MNDELNDMEWIDGYEALKRVNCGNAFTVPENYFEELAQNTQSRIAIDGAAQEGFTIPENYFDELTQNINSHIAIDEALNISQGFTIPENYFEALENKILQNTTNVPV